jgi:hypothetical protein
MTLTFRIGSSSNPTLPYVCQHSVSPNHNCGITYFKGTHDNSVNKNITETNMALHIKPHNTRAIQEGRNKNADDE